MNRRTFLRGSSALGALTLAGCMADANDTTNSGNEGSPTPDRSDDPPKITGSSIERTANGCASYQGDDAAKTPKQPYASTSTNESELTVSFTGQIETPNPCYLPTVARTEYDAENGRLTIVVGTEAEDEVCIDCVGIVEFEGSVSFENGLPGDVVVVHDGETLTPESGESTQPTEGESTSSETPTLRASSFSVTNVSSSSPEQSADASFDEDEGAVVVTGTIVGNNGCMTADVGAVNYDAEDDVLSVDVVTTEREDAGMCTQQLVGIDYRAKFAFEGGIPSSVSVSHDGQGVMSAGYGSSSASAPDSDDGGDVGTDSNA